MFNPDRYPDLRLVCAWPGYPTPPALSYTRDERLMPLLHTRTALLAHVLLQCRTPSYSVGQGLLSAQVRTSIASHALLVRAARPQARPQPRLK